MVRVTKCTLRASIKACNFSSGASYSRPSQPGDTVKTSLGQQQKVPATSHIYVVPVYAVLFENLSEPVWLLHAHQWSPPFM